MRLAAYCASIAIALAGCSSHDREPDKQAKPAASKPAAATPPAPPGPPAATGSDGYDAASLGALTYEPPDGSPAARAHFKRGLLALHSFWYDEAVAQFQAALDADPTMRMAYWGAAMSRIQLLWGNDDIAGARQILSRMPDADNLPPRETAWVFATLELVGSGDDVRTSRRKFVAAMEDVHKQFPDDESTTFLAIALLSATRPEDPDNRAVRTRAAELALSVFAHNPKHPGAAHYAIHAYDTPELAKLALPVARAYAQIAPAAFHARHMPAHIFARLGMWQEAITSCRAAWEASLAAAQREHRSADHDDFHSLNWLIEMDFELGHRADADAALALFGNAVHGGLGHAMRTQYALQVLSYLARTGEWARAEAVLAPLAAPATEESGAPMAHCGSGGPSPAAPASVNALLEQVTVLHVRAYAAAMTHDAAATKKLIADMDTAQTALRAQLAGSQPADALATIDAAYAHRRAVLLARAASDDHALLAALRDSVAEADQLETGGESVQTGLLVREQIADTLLRLGQAGEAATEYAHVLTFHPRRGHALLGAARAATKLHDAATAHARYQELVELWATADPTTDGLAEARAAVVR